MSQPRAVVRGTADIAVTWLLYRTVVFGLLGVAFAVSEGDARPAIVVGSALMAYVVAWFAYMMVWPRRVSYEFDAETIRARRGSVEVACVSIEDIDRVWPSWWQQSAEGAFAGMWPWLPRFGCDLTDSREVKFPYILIPDWVGDEAITRIAAATSLTFESSLDRELIYPNGDRVPTL